MVTLKTADETAISRLSSTTDINEMSLQEITTIAGAHILLVEDNKMNQQVVCELLQQAQFTITIANNGQQALDTLKDNNFDLI